MNRFKGLWRDTWWLWLILNVFGITMGIRVKFVFFVTIPISIITFFYFGAIRYDNDGNPKEDLMG